MTTTHFDRIEKTFEGKKVVLINASYFEYEKYPEQIPDYEFMIDVEERKISNFWDTVVLQFGPCTEEQMVTHMRAVMAVADNGLLA